MFCRPRHRVRVRLPWFRKRANSSAQLLLVRSRRHCRSPRPTGVRRVPCAAAESTSAGPAGAVGCCSCGAPLAMIDDVVVAAAASGTARMYCRIAAIDERIVDRPFEASHCRCSTRAAPEALVRLVEAVSGEVSSCCDACRLSMREVPDHVLEEARAARRRPVIRRWKRRRRQRDAAALPLHRARCPASGRC